MRRDLYSGVTAARCMGDDSRALADLARAARVSEIPGPDLYYVALFAGPDFMNDSRMIAITCASGRAHGSGSRTIGKPGRPRSPLKPRRTFRPSDSKSSTIDVDPKM